MTTSSPTRPFAGQTHDALLSVTDVAERLNVSTATVHRLIQVRDLGHVRIGRRGIRVPQSAIEEYVQSRSVRRLV